MTAILTRYNYAKFEVKCAIGGEKIPKDATRWKNEEGKYCCQAHIPDNLREAAGLTVSPPPPHADNHSQGVTPKPVPANVPQETKGNGTTPAPASEKTGDASEVTSKENSGTEPPAKAEPVDGSRAPVQEGSSESWRVVRIGGADLVWVCRRTEFGRLELAATVHPLEGEALQQQIDRARKTVREAFRDEARQPVA